MLARECEEKHVEKYGEYYWRRASRKMIGNNGNGIGKEILEVRYLVVCPCHKF
jgi:hypothetical protein